MIKRIFFSLLILFVFVNCGSNNPDPGKNPEIDESKKLTIFFINDAHGQINNFAKIKYIVDEEKKTSNVMITSSGDLFSGNPVVDNHPEKGFPMIDLMNQVGFDVAVIGNHEYDYGENNLKNRINQANFDWVCANVDMSNSSIPEPLDFKTITLNKVKVTFLGLVETNGKDNGIIPSTHPWRVANFTFEKPQEVLNRYTKLKETEGSDLFIALTHLGHTGFGSTLGDVQLANLLPSLDIIIGGHSHQIINDKVNEIPIYQTGDYLNNLGKIEITILDKKISNIQHTLIDLNNYSNEDQELKELINSYNNLPYLSEEIGVSHRNHNKSQVGCFYTDALRAALSVDVSFQNNGGIRSTLNEGEITKREIFEISPFNNGTVIYEMTILDIKTFLKESNSGFYYSGIQVEKDGNEVDIKDLEGNFLPDDQVLTIGMNDYIPAVHDSFFPSNGVIQPLTDAETIISYLENINSEVDYSSCNSYFRFN